MTELVSHGPVRAGSPWSDVRVLAVKRETATAKTFELDLGHPAQHLPGQHYVVRLTAPDGYQASRSYSVASAPDGRHVIELTVERLPGGEVSEFLHDVVQPGDELEVRGPIGRWFVWEGETPALLVGGGSGVIPLMAMLRFARARGLQDLVRLVLSVRAPGDLYYASEIGGAETTIVYTRAAPRGSGRPPGRLVASDLEDLLEPPALPGVGLPLQGTVAYVCGSSAFVEHASQLALKAGLAVGSVRTERFGPSG